MVRQELGMILENKPPFNLHPWKWFEGYPVKSTPLFSRWQKHLRFFRSWHPFFFKVIVIQKEKKQPGLFSFWTSMTHLFFLGCHPRKFQVYSIYFNPYKTEKFFFTHQHNWIENQNITSSHSLTIVLWLPGKHYNHS